MTRKTEYALIALSHMQQFSQGNLVSTKELASIYQMPIELLAKILQQLAHADILESVKGAHGGYKIKKPLDQISLIDFFEILEGIIGLVNCHRHTECSQEQICNIKTPMDKINNHMRGFFNGISLREVIS